MTKRMHLKISTINSFIEPTLSDSATARGRGATWLGAIEGVWARIGRRRRSDRLDWSALNEHLLQDIGETRASADSELLRRPWNAPLGTLGCHEQPNGRSLLAFRTSPMG